MGGLEKVIVQGLDDETASAFKEARTEAKRRSERSDGVEGRRIVVRFSAGQLSPEQNL